MHKERRAIITALVASFALLRTCVFLAVRIVPLLTKRTQEAEEGSFEWSLCIKKPDTLLKRFVLQKSVEHTTSFNLLCLQNFNTLYAAYSTFRLMFGEEQWFLLGDTKESDYLIVSVCFAPAFVFSKTRSSKAPDNNCVLFNGDVAVRDYAALSKTTHFLDARATKS